MSAKDTKIKDKNLTRLFFVLGLIVEKNVLSYFT
jgi:hypothetical protein